VLDPPRGNDSPRPPAPKRARAPTPPPPSGLTRPPLQPSILAHLLLAVGARALAAAAGAAAARWGARAAAGAAAGGRALCLAAAALQLARGWARSDLSQNRVVDGFARHQLGALPRGAVALTSGDLQYYPLLYLQACEGARPDVAVLNTAMMKGEWFAQKQVLPRQRRFHQAVRRAARRRGAR
jgi:hypothetical protein